MITTLLQVISSRAVCSSSLFSWSFTYRSWWHFMSYLVAVKITASWLKKASQNMTGNHTHRCQLWYVSNPGVLPLQSKNCLTLYLSDYNGRAPLFQTSMGESPLFQTSMGKSPLFQTSMGEPHSFRLQRESPRSFRLQWQSPSDCKLQMSETLGISLFNQNTTNPKGEDLCLWMFRVTANCDRFLCRCLTFIRVRLGVPLRLPHWKASTEL